MISNFRCWILVGLSLLVATGPLAAQETDPRTEQALIHLEEMGAYIGGLESFSFTTHASFDEFQSDQTVEYTQVTDVYVSRPRGFRANTKGDLADLSMWYDGNEFAVHDHTKNFFATHKYSGSLDGLTQQLATKLGIVLPAAELLHDAPTATLLKDVASVFYVGRHPVDGVPCHHIAGRTKAGVEWQVWIEDGLPVPRKIAVKDNASPHAPRSVAVLRNWKVCAPLPKSMFMFVAPLNAVEIDFTPPKGQK